MDAHVVWDLVWTSLQGGHYDINALRARVRDDSHFIEDMGIDSLDLVEFYLRLEERFNVKLKEDDYARLTSVQAITALLAVKGHA
jgi:acyl carrier protein